MTDGWRAGLGLKGVPGVDKRCWALLSDRYTVAERTVASQPRRRRGHDAILQCPCDVSMGGRGEATVRPAGWKQVPW